MFHKDGKVRDRVPEHLIQNSKIEKKRRHRALVTHLVPAWVKIETFSVIFVGNFVLFRDSGLFKTFNYFSLLFDIEYQRFFEVSFKSTMSKI